MAQVSHRENQASAYSSDEDEESSMLANLLAMFPSLEHEVIVTVLRAHDGRVQAAVEYLMNSTTDPTQEMGGAVGLALPIHSDPARDMVGQFSDDIGGLPEMLPTFLFDREEDETNSEEGSARFLEEPEPNSPSPPQDGGQGFIVDEPLPTYEEACEGSEIPHLPRFSQQHPQPSTAAGDEELPESPDSGNGIGDEASTVTKKRGKKKLSKIARKLAPRKRSGTKLKYKAVQEKYVSDANGLKSRHQPYQPIVDDDELEVDLPTP